MVYDRTIFERVQKNQHIEKITFKLVKMKFLAMHIIKFTVGHFLNIFMEYDLNILMIFGIKKV